MTRVPEVRLDRSGREAREQQDEAAEDGGA